MMQPPVDYHHALPAVEPTEKSVEGEKPQSFPWASLELLKNYGKGNNYINTPPKSPTTAGSGSGSTRKLSLGEIMKLAGELFIQLSSHKVDGYSASIHPYAPPVFMSELSPPETADVELVQVLLLAAECVRQRQFDLASGLITRCMWISSDDGNPAQRIVFYFAEALQRRVEVETGRTTVERLNEQSSYAKCLEVDFNVAFLAVHQALPFSQVMQFAAMQSLADHLKSAAKIHLVDIHIRSGIQWTVLMQSMAEREDPPEIRITAVGTTTNKHHVEEAGKRLQCFAENLRLTFSFNSIILYDMKELKEDMFGKNAGESVAVYAPLILRTMLSAPESMGNVIKVIRRLKPEVMLVMEVEANHNSTSFINRFTESLFYYSALFDCLADCMAERKNNADRKVIEGIYFGEGIRNMVGTDGDTRFTRNVTIEVWREFFSKYRMEEVDLGDAAVRQANLILNKFPQTAASCKVTTIGKGLLTAWKGTPIHSLTAWKFT